MLFLYTIQPGESANDLKLWILSEIFFSMNVDETWLSYTVSYADQEYKF